MSFFKNIYDAGFNLIELLITLVIIGLLATLTVPVYSHYFIKTKRLEAESMLIRLSLAMEAYQVNADSYQTATLDSLKFPSLIVNNSYQLQIASASDTDYLLLAIPLGKQTEDACGTLSLNAQGIKSMTGNADDCW